MDVLLQPSDVSQDIVVELEQFLRAVREPAGAGLRVVGPDAELSALDRELEVAADQRQLLVGPVAIRDVDDDSVNRLDLALFVPFRGAEARQPASLSVR